MSFNIISALNDNCLSFIQIPNDLNEIEGQANADKIGLLKQRIWIPVK